MEFGGGYGAMALVAQRLGHREKWFIIDLPEFLLLQEYYLSNAGADMDRIVFMPQLEKPGGCGLIVGMWSLSEAPMETRNQFVETVSGDSYMLAYMSTWLGINNDAWFASLRERESDVQWTIASAARGSFYMFGRRE